MNWPTVFGEEKATLGGYNLSASLKRDVRVLEEKGKLLDHFQIQDLFTINSRNLV